MKNFGKALAATAGLLGLLAGAPAVAGPTLSVATCNNGTIDLGASGSVAYQNLGAGVCVQVIDKLFGGFTFGSGFVPDNLVTWNTLIISGVLVHQISFNNAYVNGNTYNLGFEVTVTDPTLQIVSLGGDFTQSAGTGINSILTKNSDPTGNPLGGINLHKTGTVASGPDLILYPGGVTDLIINEQLVNTGAVSSITNTIVENGIPIRVPEPASLALLGIGLSALGFSRRRKQS